MELLPGGFRPPSSPETVAPAQLATGRKKFVRKAAGDAELPITKKLRNFVSRETLAALQEAKETLANNSEVVQTSVAKETARIQSSTSSTWGLTTHFLSRYCLSYIGIKSEGVKAQEHIENIVDDAVKKFCETGRTKEFINALHIALENNVEPALINGILHKYRGLLEPRIEAIQIEIRQKGIEGGRVEELKAIFAASAARYAPRKSDQILWLLQQPEADKKIAPLLNASPEELKVTQEELTHMIDLLQQNPEYHPILVALKQVVEFIHKERGRLETSALLHTSLQALDAEKPKEFVAKLQEAFEAGLSESQYSLVATRKRKISPSVAMQIESELRQKILENQHKVKGAPSDEVLGKLGASLFYDLNRLQANITLADKIHFWSSQKKDDTVKELLANASLEELLIIEAPVATEEKMKRLAGLVEGVFKGFAENRDTREFLNGLQRAIQLGFSQAELKRIMQGHTELIQPHLKQIRELLKLAVLDAYSKVLFDHHRKALIAMADLFGWTLSDITPKKIEVSYLRATIERPMLLSDVTKLAGPYVAFVGGLLDEATLHQLPNSALQEVKTAINHCQVSGDLRCLIADLHWAKGDRIESLRLYEQIQPKFAPDDPRNARLFPQHIKSQLHDIFELSRKIPEKHTVLFNFCIELVHESLLHGLSGHYPTLPRTFLTARAEETLGMLILLLDKDPAYLQSNEWSASLQQCREKIEEGFTAVLKRSLETIEAIVSQTHRLPLTTKAALLEVAIPIEIAKLLITPTGEMNHAIISHVKSSHLGHKKERSSFEKYIARSLKQYARSPETRAALAAISKPDPANLAGVLAIRATLDIPPGAPITDKDARIAALSATLSHWRQGPIESCYVSAFIIQTTTNALIKALQDFKALLQVGYLEREVKGDKVRFYSIANHEQRILDINFTLDPATYVVKKVGDTLLDENPYLHESPLFVAVCRELGIEDVQGALRVAVASKMAPTGTVSPRALIEHLATQRFLPESPEYAQAVSRSNFIYISKRTQPLLRIWENTLAGMKYAPKSGDVKELEFLKSKLKEAILQYADSKQVKLVEAFIKGLPLDKIRYFFDPAVTGFEKPKAAFVMFYRTSGENYERIDSPEKFQQVLKAILEEGKKPLQKLVDVMTRPENLKDMVDAIVKSWVATPGAENELPWALQTGGSIASIYQIYWQAPMLDKRLGKVRRENLQQSMMNVLSIAAEYQRLNIQNKDFSLPVSSEGHAFTLLPLHPSIPRDIHTDSEIREWCQTYLSNGQKLGASFIDEETKGNLAYFCGNEYFETAEEKSQFSKEVERIGKTEEGKSQKISLHDYIGEILKIVEAVRKKTLTTEGKNNDIEKFDEYLYEWGLSANFKRQLDKSLIRFADFNWVFIIDDKKPGGKAKRPTLEHGQFCFLVNPRTQNLGTLIVSPDGSRCFAGHDKDASFFVSKLDDSIVASYKEYHERTESLAIQLESAQNLADLESQFLHQWKELIQFSEKIDMASIEHAKEHLLESKSREPADVVPAKRRLIASKPRDALKELQLTQTDLFTRIDTLMRQNKQLAPELAHIQREVVDLLTIPINPMSDAEFTTWQKAITTYLLGQVQIVEKLALTIDLLALREEHKNAVQKVLQAQGNGRPQHLPEFTQVPALAEASEREALAWLYGTAVH